MQTIFDKAKRTARVYALCAIVIIVLAILQLVIAVIVMVKGQQAETVLLAMNMVCTAITFAVLANLFSSQTVAFKQAIELHEELKEIKGMLGRGADDTAPAADGDKT